MKPGDIADLQKAIKALRIYDECMDYLSCFVGQMRGRCGEECHNTAVDMCRKAMKAKKILDQLEKRSSAA